MSILEIRDFLQENGMMIQTMSFIGYCLYFKVRNAFVYSSFAVVIITPLHFIYEKFLLSLAGTSYESFIVDLWYPGFSITDSLLVVFVLAICKRKSLKIDKISRLIILSYVILSAVQMMRYLDRIILSLDVTGEVYRVIIPTINCSVIFLIFANAVLSITYDLYKKEK